MTELPTVTDSEIPHMAAIDMGSNSFHMVIARTESGEIRPVQKIAEKVMLATGLQEDNSLDEAALERGLACLRRFAQCLEGISPRYVRCVGTNTLRKARNGNAFLREARKILKCPVEVVNGREEARLIYLGVSHSLAQEDGHRLVFDIGGGSTEFIIGKGFEPILTESLHMGCVSYRERFFPQRQISEQGFRRAVIRARLELTSIERSYRDAGWGAAVGASGTVKAIKNALIEHGWYQDGIHLDGLYKLRDKVLSFSTLDDIDIAGIKVDRRTVLPSGLAILIAIFEQLGVEKARFSDGAMREGILYDMLGRHAPEDVRERTVRALMKRYSVDETQAERVQQTAMDLFRRVEQAWDLGAYCQDWLNWSALCHEIGLVVSHSGYHRHGAYLLSYSDLPGFTRKDQKIMATLVGCHRRKVRTAMLDEVLPHLLDKVRRLIMLLRLAVVFNRSRRDAGLPVFSIAVQGDSIHLAFEPDWINRQPLLLADLQQEQDIWKKLGATLDFE